MSSTLQPSMARRGCGGTQKILCFFTVLSLLINFLAHSFGWQPYKIKCCYCFHGCIHKTLPAHSRDHHTLQETTAPPPFPHSLCTRWLFVHSFLDHVPGRQQDSSWQVNTGVITLHGLWESKTSPTYHKQHSHTLQSCSAGVSLLPSLPPLPCSSQDLLKSILEHHFLFHRNERCFHQLQGRSIKPAVPNEQHTQSRVQTTEFCSRIHQIWLPSKRFNSSICTRRSINADWEFLFGIMLPFVYSQLKCPQLDFSMGSSGTLSLTSPPSKGL